MINERKGKKQIKGEQPLLYFLQELVLKNPKWANQGENNF